MDIQRETALKYQGLFNLMAKEHGLILEQSEMDEIIKEAMAVVKLFNATAVSKSVKPVRVITGCELGLRYDKCDRFKATNNCRHCPFSI